MADVIGWIGTALMVVGSIWIAHKNINGLWMMLLGNVTFIVAGYMAGLSSLVAVSILMAVLDGYGIYQWRKDGR